MGDVNGDGFADFLVAGRSGEIYENTGAAWLYLGSVSPSAADWNAMSSLLRVALGARRAVRVQPVRRGDLPLPRFLG